MSVAVFDDHELEALWGAIDPHDTDVARHLFTLGCANRAAYMAAYSEPVHPPKIEAPRIGVVPGWCDGKVGEWLRNLLYNCVSNAGSDFAPERAKSALLIKVEMKEAAARASA